MKRGAKDLESDGDRCHGERDGASKVRQAAGCSVVEKLLMLRSSNGLARPMPLVGAWSSLFHFSRDWIILHKSNLWRFSAR